MPRASSSLRRSAMGSLVEGESSFNIHRFDRARNDARRPYPIPQDVYLRSDIPHPTPDFADIGLHDFFVAHRRVARRKMDRLALEPYQAGFLARGVQPRMDTREPYNQILEASYGAAAPVCVYVFAAVG